MSVILSICPSSFQYVCNSLNMSIILSIYPSSSLRFHHPLYVLSILSSFHHPLYIFTILSIFSLSIILSMFMSTSIYLSSYQCIRHPLNVCVFPLIYMSSSNMSLFQMLWSSSQYFHYPLNVSAFLPISLLSFQYVHYFFNVYVIQSIFPLSSQCFRHSFNVSINPLSISIIISICPSFPCFRHPLKISVIFSIFPLFFHFSNNPDEFKLKNAEKV